MEYSEINKQKQEVKFGQNIHRPSQYCFSVFVLRRIEYYLFQFGVMQQKFVFDGERAQSKARLVDC